MFYISEFDKMNVFTEDVLNKEMYLFDLNIGDYLHRTPVCWEKSPTTFRMVVNGFTYDLPSAMFVLCACESGNSDWVQIEELINREIPVLQLNTGFDSWIYGEPVISTIEPEVSEHIFLPSTRSVIPITDRTGQKVILLSYIDVYHKSKDEFEEFFEYFTV